MRILDLGAHDGFVGTWLARQLEEVHIDGVEANSDAVRIANERAKREGISGTYVQGLAEDAGEHFTSYSYDAVVAFELIEHVPNVETFLDACESMCKTGTGRVYLSTPDGTFGEGKNPHHLRVYRATDLFELCRRRGRVDDMLVGHDGVTVICYTPGQRKPELAIYTGPGWEKWHPTDIERKGLGGSETAAIKLAHSLSRDYTVTVYGECDFCAYRNVQYKPHLLFDPLEPREVVIASRTPWLVDRPVNAGRTLLWMHDTDYGKEMTPERVDKFDAIMVLSEWHKEYVIDLYPWTEGKVEVTSNAIEPTYFAGEVPEVRAPIATFSSSPDRGLDLLLSLWSRVRDAIPDAELHYCYSSVYDKVAQQNPEIAAFRDKVRSLSEQPGVVNLGSLTQKKLGKQMLKSSVWLAPSYNTVHDIPFNETYCIGAQEAAAAGCALVVSDWGALSERVEMAVNSIAIPAPEDGKGIREDEWVQAIVNSMTIPVHQKSLLALSQTWDKVADDFKNVICNGLATVER